jgi:hypothetical protein
VRVIRAKHWEGVGIRAEQRNKGRKSSVPHRLSISHKMRIGKSRRAKFVLAPTIRLSPTLLVIEELEMGGVIVEDDKE